MAGGKRSDKSLASAIEHVDDDQPPHAPDASSAAWLRAVRRNLRRGYANHRRAMPWRAAPGETADPYHVLVSETMLQQTQVATVVPYFQRFIRIWPTLADLAAADAQDVLSAWQGLGYYRRARNLHRCAQVIVADHGGVVPDSLDALRNLPGVGRYTAGAIRSIAFQKPAPILDGNVARVLARLTGLDTSTDQPAGRDQLWHQAERLVHRTKHPGDLNQALMELGATVCLPRGPRCLLCPVRNQCVAHATGRTEELPVRDRRKPPRAVVHDVLVLERAGRLAFEQRGPDGLWAGLWQMPTLERDDAQQRAAATVKQAAAARGIHLNRVDRMGDFEHLTTHRRIRFVLWRCVLGAKIGALSPNGSEAEQWAWCAPDAVTVPLSNAQRRAVDLARDALGDGIW